ncbi:MAG: nucleotide exchange factor GrpE [Lachnospiraceae bacterium]|nr:nucleotide exchange factor GrpE [Lachnospiraceae bacterium]
MADNENIKEEINEEELAAEETAEEVEETAEENTEPDKKERKLNWTKKVKEAADSINNEVEGAAQGISDSAKELAAEANERYTRLFAEFDNFRKRTEREKSTMYDAGARDMVSKILPVLDDFERGMAAVPEDERDSVYYTGMEKIYKQFLQILKNAGVEQIEAVGQPFDTNYHNAVMHVEDDSVGENIVVEEFQKGYTYKGTVVRYSMVKVAN